MAGIAHLPVARLRVRHEIKACDDSEKFVFYDLSKDVRLEKAKEQSARSGLLRAGII